MPLSYQNNVEHALISQSRGRVVIPEPINYEDGNRNIYERSKKTKGFFKTKTNSLQFYNEGFDFFGAQLATKGLAEDVILQKKAKNRFRLDERWETISETYMDMGEFETDEDKGTAKTKSTEGGLMKVLDSGLSKNLDVLAQKSSDDEPILAGDGESIGPLKTVVAQLDSREIPLRSELFVEDATLIKAVVSGGDNLNARSIPFKVEVNSDSNDISSTYGSELSAGGGTYASLSADKQSNCFYTNADQDTEIKINGRVEIKIVNPNSGTLRMDLITYAKDTFAVKSIKPLATGSPASNGNVISYDFDNELIEIEEGDSLAIGVLTNTSDGVWYEVQNTRIYIEEDSYFRVTSSRAVKPYDMGERLVLILSGQRDSFRSSLMESGGVHENRLLANGFFIRQFPDIIQEGTEDERRIQFKNSLKQFLEHHDALSPIAWWVEREGDKEIMRVESLKYTQQNFVGIKYGKFTLDSSGNKKVVYIQAKKIKRKVLKDNYYGTIKLGSKKGGDGYEEVFGLQSISGQAEWSTINDKSTSEYVRLSPYRLGDVDVELPRRKQYEDFPETDTRYDSDIMCLDCKVINGNYYLKKWADVYEEAPANIYRVDSAFNIEFTPANFFIEHSFVINAGLYHYPQLSVKFESSNCNSSFKSKKPGKYLLVEDAPIPHLRLDKPRIRPRSVDLVLPVDQDLEATITARTNDIPNWFGLVGVQTNDGIEYMRLIKVDANKGGKHKLVEAYL